MANILSNVSLAQILHTILESRELYYFIVEKDAAEACEWKFVPR